MASEARPARELHVEPTGSGRWVVCYGHRQQPLSEHPTASEATAKAQRLARAEGVVRVFLHDSYMRVHQVGSLHLGRLVSADTPPGRVLL